MVGGREQTLGSGMPNSFCMTFATPKVASFSADCQLSTKISNLTLSYVPCFCNLTSVETLQSRMGTLSLPLRALRCSRNAKRTSEGCSEVTGKSKTSERCTNNNLTSDDGDYGRSPFQAFWKLCKVDHMDPWYRPETGEPHTPSITTP